MLKTGYDQKLNILKIPLVPKTVDSPENMLKDNENLAKSTMCCIMFILIWSKGMLCKAIVSKGI